MNLKTQKKIAKEIVILFSSIVLACMFFLLVYLFNWIYGSKSLNLKKEILIKTELMDSLIIPYESKLMNQQWFYNENAKRYDISTAELNTADKLWARLEKIYYSDSLEYKYNNIWNIEVISLLDTIGFKSASEFNNFIASNIISISDEASKAKANELEKDIEKIKIKIHTYEAYKLTPTEQKKFGLNVWLGLLILIYPLRFFYFLIRWSFRVLRQKAD